MMIEKEGQRVYTSSHYTKIKPKAPWYKHCATILCWPFRDHQIMLYWIVHHVYFLNNTSFFRKLMDKVVIKRFYLVRQSNGQNWMAVKKNKTRRERTGSVFTSFRALNINFITSIWLFHVFFLYIYCKHIVRHIDMAKNMLILLLCLWCFWFNIDCIMDVEQIFCSFLLYP